MDSIKDKVAIVGMGCTKFGENWEMSIEDMMIDAAYEAYEDAGIEPKDIQGAWFGNVWSGHTGQILATPLKLAYIPVTHVENACATGSEALRGAVYAVAAGVCVEASLSSPLVTTRPHTRKPRPPATPTKTAAAEALAATPKGMCLRGQSAKARAPIHKGLAFSRSQAAASWRLPTPSLERISETW